MSIQEAHRTACLDQQSGYLDPNTNLFVMTEWFLRNRGKCCGNGCRHCPFGETYEQGSLNEPIQYHGFTTGESVSNKVALFWSGGKDSFLAYRHLTQNKVDMFLITTFANGMVGHQEIPIEVIIRQAESMQLPLVLVPLHSDKTYEQTVLSILNDLKPSALAFGDLHLEGIRKWREEHFQNFELLFPLWKMNYQALAESLFSANVSVKVSSLGDLHPSETKIKVGDEFNWKLIELLSEHNLDTFGERGEFHTVVEFW